MSPQSWLWLLFGLIAVGLLFYTLLIVRRKPSQLTCQHCGSADLQEIRREPFNARTVEATGGGNLGAGGDVRLQLDYKVTYRCNSCRKDTTLTLPQTF